MRVLKFILCSNISTSFYIFIAWFSILEKSDTLKIEVVFDNALPGIVFVHIFDHVIHSSWHLIYFFGLYLETNMGLISNFPHFFFKQYRIVVGAYL